MSFGPREYISHILDECDFLVRSLADLELEQFLASAVLRRACQRSLEIIGEASKQVDPAFKTAHPQVPWKDMAAMRDRLIHGYFGVDDAIVWDVVKTHIPAVTETLRAITGPRLQ
jgi:uncharacterized protein with HEPN domain